MRCILDWQSLLELTLTNVKRPIQFTFALKQAKNIGVRRGTPIPPLPLPQTKEETSLDRHTCMYLR